MLRESEGVSWLAEFQKWTWNLIGLQIQIFEYWKWLAEEVEEEERTSVTEKYSSKQQQNKMKMAAATFKNRNNIVKHKIDQSMATEM